MRPTLALLSLLLIGLGLVATASGANEPEDADSFAGKVLLIILDEKGAAYPLTEAKIQNLGGQSFIVGVGAEMLAGGHWLTGTKLRIAINRVSMMAEFTPAEYEKYRASVNARRGAAAVPPTP